MSFEFKIKQINTSDYFNRVGHVLDKESKYFDWFIEIVFDSDYRMGFNKEYCYVYYYTNEIAYDSFVPIDDALFNIQSQSDIDFNLIKWLTPKEIDDFVIIGKLLPAKI